MSETVKATIIGTIIIGIFMLIAVKMATNTVVDMALKTKYYIEANKVEAKKIIKLEKRKAKEVLLDAAQIQAEKK